MVSAALTVSTVNAGGLSLHLVWKEMALVLMAVACPHPETVFHDEPQKFGLLVDAAIELAVALAGLEGLEIDHSYFQSKASAMQPNVRRTETMWSLGPRDSRVMLICRMRNWEKANDELIRYEKIPIEMIEAYAEKIGISDTSKESIMSSLQIGKGLVGAILASYTEASHHACSKRGFDNLIKANEVQKSFGYRASLKARDNRIAKADARNIARGISPLKRKPLVCLICSRNLLSRQGLFEHIRVEHQSFRYRCEIRGCGKEFKGRSGLRDHKRKKH